MKAVILAGGLGTRLSEETSLRPKPMVEVGGYPILWHIMKTYAAHGVEDFVICCGYKGEVIKEWFANYSIRTSDVTFDLGKQDMTIHRARAENWRVTLVDTGAHSMTGGRLRRVAEYLNDDEPFCFTYGDGVSDIDITALLEFHQAGSHQATMTVVQPPGRFGALVMAEGQTRIEKFHEKPKGDDAWINGGYFVLDPAVIDLIDGDACVWEQEPLRALANSGQLCGYKHDGFWQPMDTLRDKNLLEGLWSSDEAPWKVW